MAWLALTQSLKTKYKARALRRASPAELSKLHKLKTLHVEVTSECNLRCVYCAVSQPGYNGLSITQDRLSAIGRLAGSLKPAIIAINGHGETTSHPGWRAFAEELLAHSLQLHIISNFSRPFSEEEIATLSKFLTIEISVDTHDRDLLRKIRRKVDIADILNNIMQIKAVAAAQGLPGPKFSWSVVLTDKNAHHLLKLTHLGLASGVKQFTICNLAKYDDVEGDFNVQPLSSLDDAAFASFLEIFGQARSLVGAQGGVFSVNPGFSAMLDDQIARRQLK